MEDKTMRPISSKKIIIGLLVLIALSRWDQLAAFASNVYEFFYDALAPVRHGSADGRFLVALALLALLFVTIFKLLYKK
jgi:hypothetical protein